MWNNLSYIELISAILGMVGVWLNARPHIWGWPIGIISVLLAMVVYFQSRLYAESGLQVFYAVSGLYGWWKWHQEKEALHLLKINRISVSALLLSLLIGILLTIGIAWLLIQFTQADFPVLDSALAAFSLVAQIWLARKYLENWLLWILIDTISLGFYAVKGLWFFMGYFVVLTLIAVEGYFQWRKRC